MATASEIITTLNSLPAKRLQNEVGTRETHSLKDLLDLMDRIDSGTINASKKSPIRLQKIRPGGTV